MDSAVNRALAALLIHVDRVCSCTHFHLTIPTRPLLAGLFIMYTVFLDFESIFLLVVSMGIMLMDFASRFPFTQKSKEEALQQYPTSPVLYEKAKRSPASESSLKSEWKVDLDPETASLDAALADLCQTVFGSASFTSPKTPTCKLIALGPALLEPAPKLGRVLGAIARLAAEAFPGAKIYGFERTSTSPGFSGGSMEVVVVMPCPDLIEQLGDRLQRGFNRGHLTLTTAKLHKSALRYLIDQLVSAGFKFRCSAFKAQEPVVSLSAPLGLCGGHGVYISMSINNPLPFLETVLTHHASVSDARAVPLIAAVQRWAEARNLAHHVFGPLTMYGWVHSCLFFLIHHAQPRMPHLVMKPRFSGFLEPGKEYPPLDPGLLEKFLAFCAKFPFGRNHMWLGDSIGPGTPFIEDALRPGVDLGYHLQHKLPRQQLQTHAATAATALRSGTATVDSLIELSPVKVKGPSCNAQDDLRIMKKTRIPRETKPNSDEASESTKTQQKPHECRAIEFARGFRPPCPREVPPWKEATTNDVSSPTSTQPPSEVDIAENDVGIASREMSE
eukprot:gnl/MRDRNA2_/MRDRNA2_29438_c0_seq2.p1 gnl/MRDRNA2_/MRDRNA2_29438_c0~~gnl/MRDRNA2_/MRDRNA2_29438_c0_seq2.p1  ORF type:complete len:558 (+),score=77.04 gnl/MRDRNA2_/MRDRNA2_29438_c0_seq2:145-1818(+)